MWNREEISTSQWVISGAPSPVWFWPYSLCGLGQVRVSLNGCDPTISMRLWTGWLRSQRRTVVPNRGMRSSFRVRPWPRNHATICCSPPSYTPTDLSFFTCTTWPWTGPITIVLFTRDWTDRWILTSSLVWCTCTCPQRPMWQLARASSTAQLCSMTITVTTPTGITKS